MDDNTPAAIPWWQSRIIWAQVIGFLFAAASALGINLDNSLHLTQADLLIGVMALVTVVTTVIRATHPTPAVTLTKASAEQINSLMAAPNSCIDAEKPTAKAAASKRKASSSTSRKL